MQYILFTDVNKLDQQYQVIPKRSLLTARFLSEQGTLANSPLWRNIRWKAVNAQEPFRIESTPKSREI